MSLPAIDKTRITISPALLQAGGLRASYQPRIAKHDGTTAVTGTLMAFIPLQCNSAFATDAVAVATTDANGVCPTIELMPGETYRVTANPTTNFSTADFTAGSIVGPLISSFS